MVKDVIIGNTFKVSATVMNTGDATANQTMCREQFVHTQSGYNLNVSNPTPANIAPSNGQVFPQYYGGSADIPTAGMPAGFYNKTAYVTGQFTAYQQTFQSDLRLWQMADNCDNLGTWTIHKGSGDVDLGPGYIYVAGGYPNASWAISNIAFSGQNYTVRIKVIALENGTRGALGYLDSTTGQYHDVINNTGAAIVDVVVDNSWMNWYVNGAFYAATSITNNWSVYLWAQNTSGGGTGYVAIDYILSSLNF